MADSTVAPQSCAFSLELRALVLGWGHSQLLIHSHPRAEDVVLTVLAEDQHRSERHLPWTVSSDRDSVYWTR